MSIWDDNIRLLKNKNMFLVDKINKYIPRNVEILPTKSNSKTVKYNRILVNSTYYPESEAKTRISVVDDIDKCTMFICMGLGLGYEINEIIERINAKCALIIVIVNLDIFRSAMEIIDLSKILKFERVAILDGTDSSFRGQFMEISRSLIFYTAKVEYFIHPVVGRINNSSIQNAVTYIKERLITEIFKVGNSVEDSIVGLKHTLLNFKYISETPDIKSLKQYFTGVPAICVSSGPSLEKNIQYLKEAKGNAVVFAVESIWERLKKENIHFDFVSVIERDEPSYRFHFKDKEIGKDSFLLGNSVIYPQILEEHIGKSIVVFRNTTYVENAFSEVIGNLNGVDAGFSAANLNFAVAILLGFSPIILIGQDLAYGNEGEDHAVGTIYSDPDFQGERIQNIDVLGDDVFLNGIDGKIIRSTKAWKLFLDAFEDVIRANKVFCINATEGGANIEGTQVMTLKNAIDLYCGKKLNLDILEKIQSPSRSEISKRETLLKKEANNQLKDIEKVIELSRNTKIMLESFIKENCITEKRYDLNDYINVVNLSLNEIMKCKMPAYIIQSLYTNLEMRNVGLISLNDDKMPEQWYKQNYEFFDRVENIMYLLVDLYDEKKN